MDVIIPNLILPRGEEEQLFTWGHVPETSISLRGFRHFKWGI